MFKESFKYYKAKKPAPDLGDVLDFYKPDIKDDNRISIVKINIHQNFFGLIPTDQWQVYDIINNPGLIYIKNPFTKLGQRYWCVRCLRDYTKKPNKLNIDVHDLVPKNEEWWEYANSKKEIMKKLRWATLGYHHDWDSKVYTEESRNPFPDDLNKLCCYISKVLNFDNFNAEAAIINFYHLDSTLSGHTDHSEQNLDAPLFSFSFGNTAIFLLGGKLIDEKPTALFLQNGDIVVMSKESRLSYHGVPKILNSITQCENETSEVQHAGEEIDKALMKQCEDDLFWDSYQKYLSDSRINVNVRQVLRRGEKRLS